MKHSVLILAHKNVEQLCRLVEYFEHDCDVYSTRNRPLEMRTRGGYLLTRK